MLHWLGYSATERWWRHLASGETVWQVTAEGEEEVIVARAPTQSAAWFEACRMAERLQCQD